MANRIDKAKNLLRSIIRTDAIVDQDRRELELIEARKRMGRGIDYSKDRVQTTPTDQMDALCDLLDAEQLVRAEIARVTMMREQAVQAIHAVESDIVMDVLRYRYIRGYRLRDIPMDYSYDYIKELHMRGLKEVAEHMGYKDDEEDKEEEEEREVCGCVSI